MGRASIIVFFSLTGSIALVSCTQNIWNWKTEQEGFAVFNKAAKSINSPQPCWISVTPQQSSHWPAESAWRLKILHLQMPAVLKRTNLVLVGQIYLLSFRGRSHENFILFFYPRLCVKLYKCIENKHPKLKKKEGHRRKWGRLCHNFPWNSVLFFLSK